MVYCGKPSGGCYACRERKSRCDKLPEGCTQCAKAKRKCPGYRDLGDVIFHNESEKLVRRFKAKEAKEKAKRDPPKPSPHAIITPTSLEEVEGIIDQSLEMTPQYQSHVSDLTLLPKIEDRATGFFVSNFVVGVDGPVHLRLDYLADVYRGHSMDECLIFSMRAVGFAGYAHATQTPQLLRNARDQYAQALQHTNKALQSSVDAKKDTTLLSIIVLGLFETITGCKQRSLQDWAQHINGAAAVVKLRGKDQIRTVAGRRMLAQVTSNLLITCLARARPLPDFICKFTQDTRALVPNPDPSFLVLETMIRVTQLRADVVSGPLNDPQTIMTNAVELESILLDITENPPPGWEFETVYTDIDSPFVYNGRYHIYADCWMGQLWNAVRVVRILLNEMIRDVLIKGFAAKPPIFSLPIQTAQFQLSTDTLYTIQNDILYSVPQHIMPLTKSSPTPHPLLAHPKTIYPDYAYFNHDNGIPAVKMYGGSFLLWPLWFAGVMDVATDEVKLFVASNLRAISDTMGIKQGYVLAEIIDSGSQADAFM